MDKILPEIKPEIKYDILRPWLTLDKWQIDYISEEKNCFLLCGRQVGKTAAASIKFGERAFNKPNQTILMIALTEKQSYSLFFKTLMYLQAKHPESIRKGLKKPTKHEIHLKNGSLIMCYAAGETGLGLKGYTCTSLVIDEAAAMNREVFISCLPMLSVTGGSLDIISTPRGKEGYFYECSQNPDFIHFYVSAEDCPRHNKAFLNAEKKRMSHLEYAQEYLAVFLDQLKRLISDELINKCCILKKPERIIRGKPYFLGVDIARMGSDDTVFSVIEKINSDNFAQVENMITKKILISTTTEKILELEKIWNFRRIGIDDAGVGAGCMDFLLLSDVKRKVIALNNATRPLDRDKLHKKRLLKEDMYMNFVMLLEQGKLKLLDDDEVRASLASIQYEYVMKEGQKTQFRIFGNYSHVCESLIRAAWLTKDKHLNLYVA